MFVLKQLSILSFTGLLLAACGGGGSGGSGNPDPQPTLAASPVPSVIPSPAPTSTPPVEVTPTVTVTPTTTPMPTTTPPAIVYSYNFTGADGSPAPEGLDIYAGEFEIRDGRLYAIGDEPADTIGWKIGQDVGVTDGIVSATINANGGSSDESGLLIRYIDNDNFWDCIVSNGSIFLINVKNGTEHIAYGPYSIPDYDVDQDYTLAVSAQGNHYEVFVDGVSVLTAVNATGNNGTIWGLKHGGPFVSMDNLMVPDPIATPLPTPTPTIPPEPTPTPEPTPDAATPTPTPLPTVTPEPSPVVTNVYTFDDADNSPPPAQLTAYSGAFSINNQRLNAIGDEPTDTIGWKIGRNTGQNNGTVSAVFNANGGYGDEAGVMLRYVDNNNFWDCINVSGAISLVNITDGQITTANTYSIPDYDNTADYTLSVHVEGDNFEVFVNGDLVITKTSSTHNTGTGWGLKFAGTQVSIDNLSMPPDAPAMISNLEAETIE